ncbi:TPA: YSIRK-type signal peptide-containing protein [Streptococcus suis]|nr:YSIRK-type signal peptide-containing protein [Streptococcus suis]
MGIFTSQTKRYYSIRKYKIGVCSALIALSILGTRVAANQLPSTETASPQTSQLVETTPETTEVVTTSEVSSEVSPVTSTESQPSSTTAETLASPQAVQATKEEKNLVANGEFISTTAPSGNWKELAATDWETWIPNDIKKENGAVSIDDEKLHISSTNTYRVAMHQTVDVDPSKRYLFSYDVETKDLKGSCVRVRLRSLTAEGKDLSPQEFTFTNFVAGTQQRKVEKELTVSPETRKLKVELFFENGIGQAWLDNISLVEYVEKTPETPEPSPELVQPETGQISLASNKVYLPVRPDLTYRIADAAVATVEKNMIRPLAAGKTQVDVYDKDTKLSSFELTVTEHQATVFDTLRNNWEDISLANKRYQSNDAQMKAFLGRLDAGVASSLEKWVEPTEQSKTIFNDIDFSKSSHLTTVYRRLEQMAQVVENPDSAYYHDRSLIDLVRKGMNWLYTNVYNENKSIDGNWWDYEIGTPRAVVNTLIYMHPYFSQEEILTYTKPISKFVPDPTTIRKTLTNPVPAVGGNQTDLSKVAILEGALREDADRVRAGAQGLTTIMKFVDKGEGFYRDGSFIDHTNVAYTGAYGNVLIEGFSQLLPVIQPTEFALKEEQTNILYEWIEKAFMPILVRGELMDMTRGRSISRATGESHVQAMEILKVFGPHCRISSA